MIGPIAHRGPDDSGVWADADAGIAFGFRRLAILDVSPHGHQPMWSPSARYVAMFNGEVYNFAELRGELEALRLPPSRAVRHRGRARGVRAVGHSERGRPASSGMFAIAVWDVERRELSLMRDRLGKKPLYVYSEPGLVTFGSELKALVAGPAFDRTIDREALAAYFRYLYVPAPRSIFARAAKIPAGHILTIADAGGPAAGLAAATGRSPMPRVTASRIRSPANGRPWPGSTRWSRMPFACGWSPTSRSARCSRAGSTRRPSWR